MTLTIFVDYGFTLDTGTRYEPAINTPLAQKLREYHDNGHNILLATDGSDDSLAHYTANLAQAGFPDLLDGAITLDTFNKPKTHPSYWQNALQKFGLNADQVIFIDDNDDVIKNAERSNITVVPSLPPSKVVTNLEATYRRLTC